MPDRALELLTEHARRFPAARLAEEAAVVRIEAVCATGDRARARSLTEGFGRTWPRSPLRVRVRNMCGARP
jgi:outer membrane protein assembly factor BamD (BamD/ComL family)